MSGYVVLMFQILKTSLLISNLINNTIIRKSVKVISTQNIASLDPEGF